MEVDLGFLSLALLLLTSLFFFLYYKIIIAKSRFRHLAAKLERCKYRALPLIGHAHLALKSDGFNGVIKACDEFKDLSKPTAFWLGPKLYIGINKPEHLEIVLNSQISINKAAEFRMFSDIFSGGLIFTDNPRWRKDRKIMNGIFNQKNLESHVDVFAKYSEQLVEHLQLSGPTQQFDVSPYLMNFFFDIFFETSIGVDPEKYREHFLHEYSKGFTLIMARMLNPIYHIDFIFKRSKSGKEVKKACQNLQNFVAEIFDCRVKEYQEEFNKRTRSMFLDYLIELHLNEGAFTKDEILTELILFIFAAYDTCTAESSLIFIMLGIHQDVQENLYKEIMGVLGNDRHIDYKSLCELTYMEKVIKETMRLFPVGPMTARRIDEELDLGDYILPAPSVLVINTFGLHRNKKYHDNPLKFDPERFSPDESAKRHRYSYIPFLNGPRNCIGQKFAMMALKTIIADVVRKFRIETPFDNIQSVKVVQCLTIRCIDGYPITLSPRN